MRRPYRSSMCARNFTVNVGFNQGTDKIDWYIAYPYGFIMNGRKICRVITLAVYAGALVLAGCSKVDSRIKENPQLFQSLSPKDQELVSRGQIRIGMPQD